MRALDDETGSETARHSSHAERNVGLRMNHLCDAEIKAQDGHYQPFHQQPSLCGLDVGGADNKILMCSSQIWQTVIKLPAVSTFYARKNKTWTIPE